MEGLKIVLLYITPLFVSFVLVAIFYFLKNKSIMKFTKEMKAREREANEETKTEVCFYKSLARDYRLELEAYKLGLGILPGDRKKAAEELWERAAIGDETAYYILLELLDAELDIDLESPLEPSLKTNKN